MLFDGPLPPVEGALTIGFPSAIADWSFDPPSEDPSSAEELVGTLYHVL